MTADKKKIQAASIDDLISGKQPLVREVVIYLDDEGPEMVREAKKALDRARVFHKDEPDVIAQAEIDLEKATEKARSHARVMRFRSVGRKVYDRILRDHPATEEQDKEHREATATTKDPKGNPAPYNGDTFPQALVVASCFEPKLTLEQCEAIWENWNTAELTELFMTAIEVCTNRRVGDLGK